METQRVILDGKEFFKDGIDEETSWAILFCVLEVMEIMFISGNITTKDGAVGDIVLESFKGDGVLTPVKQTLRKFSISISGVLYEGEKGDTGWSVEHWHKT